MVHIQASIKPLIQLVLGYLAIRIRSRHELVQYLESKTTDPQKSDLVLSYLDEHHLIDDEEFARSWAESRLRKLKGDLFIQSELRQKGISQSIIQATIQFITPEAWNSAIEATLSKYARKWESLKGYPQKAKIYTILRQRGFSSTHIDAFLKHRVE